MAAPSRRRGSGGGQPPTGRQQKEGEGKKRKRKRKKGIDLKRKDVFVQLSLFRKTYIIYTVLVITHPRISMSILVSKETQEKHDQLTTIKGV